jgi:hypothetical protein
MFDSVNKLSQMLTARGCRVIVACGSEERTSLFNAECWIDPVGTESLAQVIHSFRQEYDEEIQLFPCDMFRLDEDALDVILAQQPGIPIDSNGREQFTLARIPEGYNVQEVMSLRELFLGLNRSAMNELGNKLENFNHQDQIDALNKSNR